MNKMLNVLKQKKLTTTPNLIVDDESKTKFIRPKLLCVEEVTYIRGKQIHKSVLNKNEKEEKEDEETSPSSTSSSSSSLSFTCSISSSASSLSSEPEEEIWYKRIYMKLMCR